MNLKNPKSRALDGRQLDDTQRRVSISLTAYSYIHKTHFRKANKSRQAAHSEHTTHWLGQAHTLTSHTHSLALVRLCSQTKIANNICLNVTVHCHFSAIITIDRCFTIDGGKGVICQCRVSTHEIYASHIMAFMNVLPRII